MWPRPRPPSPPMPERHAIRVGRVTAIAHTDGKSLGRLRDRLSSRGYGIRVTPHFVVCQEPSKDGKAVLMHTFEEATIDEDLPAMVSDELGPLGIIGSAHEYDQTLRAIVASTCSTSLTCSYCGRIHLDLPAVWRQYCLNTLRRLRPLIAQQRGASHLADSHVVQFAAIYRRVMECSTGVSLLDVGSSLGFLPVLLAERFDRMSIVGCDKRQDAVACATDLARAAHTDRVAFLVRDVLAPDFIQVGRFDTVTAVHLLEHLSEEELAVALTNMLRVAARRLIVAVPYEEHVQTLYGHEQAFTREKLQIWGNWCVETLGTGRYWCEDVSGGLLVVDRHLSNHDSEVTR